MSGICLSAIRTHYFPGTMPVPSQECVGFQLICWLKTQMGELLIGFVCFCGLSLLNAPWSTVPLLLLLLIVSQQIWRNVLPLFFPRYTGVKKTQHYKLFISNPIVLFWGTKKKTNSNIIGRTVSALLTEELLEKIMLAKTKQETLEVLLNSILLFRKSYG